VLPDSATRLCLHCPQTGRPRRARHRALARRAAPCPRARAYGASPHRSYHRMLVDVMIYQQITGTYPLLLMRVLLHVTGIRLENFTRTCCGGIRAASPFAWTPAARAYITCLRCMNYGEPSLVQSAPEYHRITGNVADMTWTPAVVHHTGAGALQRFCVACVLFHRRLRCRAIPVHRVTHQRHWRQIPRFKRLLQFNVTTQRHHHLYLRVGTVFQET